MKRTIQRQKLELARRANKWKMQLWGRRSDSLQWPKSKYDFLFDQSKVDRLKGLCVRISLSFLWSSNHHLFPLTADQKQMASFISEASSMSLGGLIDPMLFPRLLKFQNYLTSFTCSSRELTVVVENPEKKNPWNRRGLCVYSMHCRLESTSSWNSASTFLGEMSVFPTWPIFWHTKKLLVKGDF